MSKINQQQESWEKEIREYDFCCAGDQCDYGDHQEEAINDMTQITSKAISAERQRLNTRHAMEMAGLEAQIEQKAVIRASELVDKARAKERQRVIEEVRELVESKKVPEDSRFEKHDYAYNQALDDLLSALKEIK